MTRRPATVLACLLALVAAGTSCSSSGNGSATPPTSATAGNATATPASPSSPNGSGTTPTTGPAERTALHPVPLPPDVLAARYANWTADGRSVVFSAVPSGQQRVELYRVGLDGADLACLTCRVPRSSDEPLLKALPFSDGKRILVRVGEQSPVKNGTHAVVACTPSVTDCQQASITPIEVPGATDHGVVQAQREFRIAPDGAGVAFTQIRTDSGGATAFVPVVGSLRLDGDRYVTDHPRVVSTMGELKNFTPDGQSVLISAFTTLPDRAANPDIIRVDLRTGAQDRITVDPDYDEDIALAPDQRSYVVFSGRTAGLFETISQVNRPNFIGDGLEALLGYLFVAHRKDLLEPWLVPMGAEQNGERGQRLNPDSAALGFDGRTLGTWSPDGTKVLFWEDKGNPFQAPSADGTRLVHVDLLDRTAAAPTTPAATPEPTWAPALAGFVPEPTAYPGSRDGKVSGHVTVVRTPDPTKPTAATVTVTYEHFSDDGAWVIDGTEEAAYRDGLTGSTHYRAALTVSGDHRGYLRSDAQISPAGMNGTIESDVDGHTLVLPNGGG